MTGAYDALHDEQVDCQMTAEQLQRLLAEKLTYPPRKRIEPSGLALLHAYQISHLPPALADPRSPPPPWPACIWKDGDNGDLDANEVSIEVYRKLTGDEKTVDHLLLEEMNDVVGFVVRAMRDPRMASALPKALKARPGRVHEDAGVMVSGRVWEKRSKPPANGREIKKKELQDMLSVKLEFSQEEWKVFVQMVGINNPGDNMPFNGFDYFVASPDDPNLFFSPVASIDVGHWHPRCSILDNYLAVPARRGVPPSRCSVLDHRFTHEELKDLLAWKENNVNDARHKASRLLLLHAYQVTHGGMHADEAMINPPSLPTIFTQAAKKVKVPKKELLISSIKVGALSSSERDHYSLEIYRKLTGDEMTTDHLLKAEMATIAKRSRGERSWGSTQASSTLCTCPMERTSCATPHTNDAPRQ